MTSILAVILVIIHLLKPNLKFGRVFDESYPYMKFGANQVKNDNVRITTKEDRRTDRGTNRKQQSTANIRYRPHKSLTCYVS